MLAGVPFKPMMLNGVVSNPLNVSASTVAASGSLPSTAAQNSDNVSIRVVNETTAVAYLSFGTTNVAAATVANGIHMLPNSERIFRVAADITNVSVLLSTGTGTVSFTRGDGI